MKHEAILEGQELLSRDPRVDIELSVRVHCEAGAFDAELTRSVDALIRELNAVEKAKEWSEPVSGA